jgi:hypothetical protein
MKRRAFLRGIGAAGGAAWAAGFSRPSSTARAKPLDRSAVARAKPLDRLREAGIGVTARVTRFDGPAMTTSDLVLGAAAGARGAAAGGTLTISAAAVAGRADAIDLLASFRPRGRAASAALGIRFGLGAWTRDDYLVLPGAAYAGNRFESRHLAYPPLLTEPADIGPNVPIIVSDIPRLNLRAGPSALERAASDLAIPAAGLYAPAARRGLILLFDPATPLGATGIGVAEADDRKAASIAVTAPFAAEDRPGPRSAGRSGGGSAGGSGGRSPGHGRGALVRDGEQVTLRARLYLFDCPDVAALYAKLFAVRKDLTGPTARVHELPFSAAFAAHEERVNRRWLETPGVFAVGARDSAYTTWQTGWGSSAAAALPLLAAGAPPSRERARRQCAFLVAEAQAPSGFFHAVTDGKNWYEDGFAAPLPSRPAVGPLYRHAQRWHLVRRSADTLVLLMKQLALYERHPEPRTAARLPADLAEAAKRTADAFVRLWDRYHQLGQFVHVDSGDLLVGGSTAAGAAPAGLALAAGAFNQPAYLRVARAAAEQLWDRYLRAGITCGGPGDALQCPDSESAAGLLESLVTLYEVTHEHVWLERARDAAHLLATWVISYEPAPVGGSGRDLRATGGVISDAQNDRGTPGYLLWSGDALFRLYRATGDVGLIELLRDTVHNLPQYLRAAPTTEPASGTGGRTDTGRWLEQPGEVVPAAAVFDAIALAAYTEVPGLYAQVDTGFVFPFDHVDARVKERLAGKLVVALTNPTRADASVRIYAEESRDLGEPLRVGAVTDAPTLHVPAGATVDVALPLAHVARR